MTAPAGGRGGSAAWAAAWAAAWPFVAAAGAVLFTWQWVVLLTHPSQAVLPSPGETLRALWALAVSGRLWVDAGASLGRVLAAWVLGALVAIPLGLLQGTRPRWRRVLEPLFELFRPISPLAWIPMAILWFGVGETGKIFILFIATFFPILLNTLAGVQGVDPVLVRAGRVLGCDSDARLFRQVILPAAMPQILVGLRIAFGTGWAAIIAAELVAANKGLGYLISNGMEILRSDQVLAGMIVIAALGLLVDTAFRWLGRRLGVENP